MENVKCEEREVVTGEKGEGNRLARAAHAQHEVHRMCSKKEQPIIWG